ncbi:LysR family transcriptional regulator [Telmatospirillum siberiense]|uniref:LysR family transcriptional regulator n=1 Tax=Telmatospirillum siberiense TaxID=382514 RepID=A0A2N3PRF1_9PROT|nr:LysR family transcriptional regulator [Telmatospirillum siberiense]PKU22978.1 LysR family transcriptional regulator [Telmatospirillum siberiense]
MTIELRDLRWAIVAYQHRSLRRAAEALNIRQSTLSRRIRELEYRLGAELFERTNGGTHATLIGREFLEIARRIVKETDAAFTRLKAMSNGQLGRLTVGVYVSLATGNLRATLAEYHRRFPDVGVHTVDGVHDQLLCNMITSTIDVAIMTTYYSDWYDRKLPLWSERVIVALPERHPLAEKSVLLWTDLVGEPLLVQQRGAGPEMQRLLAIKLDPLGVQHFLHQDVSIDRLMGLVGAGFGICLILEGATGARYEGVAYREVHDQDGPTRFNFAAYWRETNSNPTLQPFLDLLRERYPDISGAAAG